MDYEYDFSVVMAVYNVERYIDEAIQSIINQDYGFSKIQIILVDDGSPDGSGIICDRYSQEYPNNIIVVHKENGGVSTARNEGIKHIKGRFVNFCDPDDYFSRNAFSEVYNFLINHEFETDVTAIPIFFFGSQTGPHPKNYLFSKGSRIIDLKEEYNCIQTNTNNVFIPYEKAKKMHFDEALRISEDLKEVQKLLLEKQTLGVVTGCSYQYRKHDASALAGISTKRDYYIQGIDNCHQWIADFYKNTLGYIPEFIQFATMYDLQWRFNLGNIPKGTLTEEEYEHFQESLHFLLENIDDRIIASQKNINQWRKYFAYCKKYNSLPNLKIISGNNILLSHGNVVEFSMADCHLFMKTVKVENDVLDLNAEVEIPIVPFSDYKIRIRNGKWEEDIILMKTGSNQFSLSELATERYGFSVSVPLINSNNRIKFYLLADGNMIELGKKVSNTNSFPVNAKYDNDFYYIKGWNLFPFKNNQLRLEKSSRLKSIKNRIKVFRLQMKKHKVKGYMKYRIKSLGKRVIKKMPQKYIMFESLPVYSDNTRKIYDYLLDNNLLKGYSFIWHSDERDVNVPSTIKSIYKADSGIKKYIYKYYLLRSKAIIYGNRQFNKIRQDQITVNLGHGSCFKSVRGNYNMRDDLDYLLLQSSAFEEATRYEHNIVHSTVTVPLGYPRNDSLLKPKENTVFPGKKIIIWYPTYRQHINGKVNVSSIAIPFLHDEKSVAMINDCAVKNDVVLLLKPHFVQNTSSISLYELEGLRTIDDQFFQENGIESYDLLAMSDALLTDYSSVYYDYLLTNKPIGLAWEDFEEYRSREGFAVDIDTFLAGGEKLYTANDLCSFIERVSFGEDVLKEEREKINDLVNEKCEGSYTQKVSDWIVNLIQNN